MHTDNDFWGSFDNLSLALFFCVSDVFTDFIKETKLHYVACFHTQLKSFFSQKTSPWRKQERFLKTEIQAC